jgi:predicted TIM-barrel fold metal-dependent hydrolase
MNERIKQLWSEAAESNGGDSWEEQTAFMSKFAELIVKECGEVAYKAYWDNPETVRGMHIQEKIKQHFGIEE